MTTASEEPQRKHKDAITDLLKLADNSLARSGSRRWTRTDLHDRS